MRYSIALISIAVLLVTSVSCRKNKTFKNIDGTWKANSGTSTYTLTKKVTSQNIQTSIYDVYPQYVDLKVDEELTEGISLKNVSLKSSNDSLSKTRNTNASTTPFEFTLTLNEEDLSYTLSIEDVSFSSFQAKIWKTNDENDNEDLGTALIEYETEVKYFETGSYLFESNSKGHKNRNQLILTPDSSHLEKESHRNFTRLGNESSYHPDSVFYISCYCIVFYYQPLSEIKFQEDIVLGNQLLRYAYPPFNDNRIFTVETIDKETINISASSVSSDNFSVVTGDLKYEMKKQ